MYPLLRVNLHELLNPFLCRNFRAANPYRKAKFQCEGPFTLHKKADILRASLVASRCRARCGAKARGGKGALARCPPERMPSARGASDASLEGWKRAVAH